MNYRGYKVLYVDDEAANLTTFKYCFDDRFDVITALSPEEALGILAREPVAVLLADQKMPGMSGAELCRLVREQHPEVVRMIVTAYSDITAAVAAINGGQVSRYLFKPWREEQMAEVLRAGVEAYQLGALTRDLQMRLLHSEQQATTTYLLGRVLHELANPAATIHTNLEWIADSLQGLTRRAAELPPELAAMLAEIKIAAAETRQASRDLVSRIERFRRGETPSVPVGGTDLKRAIEAAMVIVQGVVRQRARLVLELAELAPVAADATQVSQVVVNLVMNASEALEGRSDGRITVRLSDGGTQALLEVEDDGAGIDAELLPRIFEPFVSTKGQEIARGFGLAIVYEIVHSLGGKIEVASEPGRGARFSVRLPFAAGR